MDKFTVKKLADEDRPWAKKYLTGHWGSPLIIVHGQQYSADELSGLVVEDENNKKIGLITYDIRQGACQIVTINTSVENGGIGKKLITAVKNIAIDNYCTRLWLITTNDNMDALRFYQRFGFVISDIRIGEVNNSRKIKRSIPKIGMNEIPIRDEIELEYVFNK